MDDHVDEFFEAHFFFISSIIIAKERLAESDDVLLFDAWSFEFFLLKFLQGTTVFFEMKIMLC